MSEPEVLQARFKTSDVEASVLKQGRDLGQARQEWAETYGFARMTASSAKDAEAAADERHIARIIELDALYQIALERLRHADPR